jgi:hypothetical protein
MHDADVSDYERKRESEEERVREREQKGAYRMGDTPHFSHFTPTCTTLLCACSWSDNDRPSEAADSR